MADAHQARIAAKPKAFQTLPVELNQQIAYFLEDDRDAVHFRASCRAARDAIDDNNSFWLKRFNDKYDPPANYHPSSPGYKAHVQKLYQMRFNHLILNVVRFKIGASRREEDTLKVVAGLINDSFRGSTAVHTRFKSGQHQLTCRNLEALKDFIGRSGIIEDMFRPRPRKSKRTSLVAESEPRYSLRLAAVQLMCAPTILQSPSSIYGFEDSQKQAYATIKAAPIFSGWNHSIVNLEWILHVLNFFKYHICKQEENTLYEPFNKLSSANKPAYWQAPLHDGPAEVGVHWKGTYAYLTQDEMRLARSGNPTGSVLIDHNVDHGDSSIQTMEITFPENASFPWPPLFEYHLRSVTEDKQLPRTRAQRRTGDDFAYERFNQRFQASGYDDEDFEAAGWFNQLPSQQGISGWKRMTMMKYFEDGQGGWDSNALWAYEGVVLPGGQIMLGRWWSPDPTAADREPYTGPFIFWNTDAACHSTSCKLHSTNDF